MINILMLVLTWVGNSPKVYIIIALILLYYIYRRKFKFYTIIVKDTFRKGNQYLFKSVPAFANGWYCILLSPDLKKRETKYINIRGENLAVFRGENNKVYALHAYCSHLGANLGIEGKVVNETCIQCPFHNWTFDGETGNCVVGDKGKQKEGIVYEYEFSEDLNKCEFKEKEKVQVGQKKFPCLEKCGYIYVYLDDSEEYSETGRIPFEPLDISEYLERYDHRGRTYNAMDCHMCEPYLNTCDREHLPIIHGQLYPSFIKNYWKNVGYVFAEDPDAEKLIGHSNPVYDEFRKKLYKKFVNESNKKYISFYLLDAYYSFFWGKKHMHLLCATGIQVGPALTYIFVIGNGFEVFWTATVEPTARNRMNFRQEFYSLKNMPYFASAYFIYSDQQQYVNDLILFDNKKMPFTMTSNENSLGDQIIIKWLQWYSRFYDGCKAKEKEKKSTEW
jgi:cholesterol 7-dehydrogenase